MTTELLTVRLNSVNEILTLQEEKIVKKVNVLHMQCMIQAYADNMMPAEPLLSYVEQAATCHCVLFDLGCNVFKHSVMSKV